MVPAGAEVPVVRLAVSHETDYHYSAPVELAHHLAFLRPLQDAAQSLLDFDLRIDPLPNDRQSDEDVFGNARGVFSITSPHRGLHVQAQSVVELIPRHEGFDPARTPPWESVRERLRYRADAPFEAASAFAFPSPMAPRVPAIAEHARESFIAGRPIGEALIDWMHRLHEELSYAPESTEISTPVAQAFAQRRGVCQDFSHIVIAGLRTLGLAARYVSGYLLTEPPPGQPRQLGADASHAWVAVWGMGEPGAGTVDGWLEVDPTNDTVADLRYVRLARGRDFSDVSPLRGVIRGGGRHTLLVRVSTTEVHA